MCDCHHICFCWTELCLWGNVLYMICTANMRLFQWISTCLFPCHTKGQTKVSEYTSFHICRKESLEQLERYAFLFAWSDKGTLEHYKLFFSFAGCSPSPRLSACCLFSLLFWSRQSFFQKGLLVSKFLFSSPSTTLVSFNATQQKVHQVWRPS